MQTVFGETDRRRTRAKEPLKLQRVWRVACGCAHASQTFRGENTSDSARNAEVENLLQKHLPPRASAQERAQLMHPRVQEHFVQAGMFITQERLQHRLGRHEGGKLERCSSLVFFALREPRRVQRFFMESVTGVVKLSAAHSHTFREKRVFNRMLAGATKKCQSREAFCGQPLL